MERNHYWTKKDEQQDQLTFMEHPQPGMVELAKKGFLSIK
jgi:hypothetical protein